MSHNKKIKRNSALFDGWSLVHVASGVLLGWIMTPLAALIIMIAWEPLEILVLSPLLARAGIVFGYETWRNALSDIIFDCVGIVIGAFILTSLLPPPFHL